MNILNQNKFHKFTSCHWKENLCLHFHSTWKNKYRHSLTNSINLILLFDQRRMKFDPFAKKAAFAIFVCRKNWRVENVSANIIFSSLYFLNRSFKFRFFSFKIFIYLMRHILLIQLMENDFVWIESTHTNSINTLHKKTKYSIFYEIKVEWPNFSPHNLCQ